MKNWMLLNVAIGGDYPKGQQRMLASLPERFDGKVLTWTDGYPPQSPSQEEVPYGFKMYAIREAERQGAECVIWVDSGVEAYKPLTPLLQEVEELGYGMCYVGANLLERCKDSLLAKWQLSREAAAGIILICGSVYLFDLTNPMTRDLLNAWEAMMLDGDWNGPHKNSASPGEPLGGRTYGHCSNDPRCSGHSHDETSIALLAWKRKLSIWSQSKLYNGFHPSFTPETGPYFVAYGR